MLASHRAINLNYTVCLKTYILHLLLCLSKDCGGGCCDFLIWFSSLPTAVSLAKNNMYSYIIALLFYLTGFLPRSLAFSSPFRRHFVYGL